MNWDLVKSIIFASKDLLLSSIVAIAVTYLFNKRLERSRLEIKFEYDERAKLRKVIGKYHGRILNAANSMNHRIWNLYSNYREEWHFANGRYRADLYYFHSTVYRFISICSLLRQFEREAVFVDSRYAEKRDLVFLKYAAILRWCMTDVALFKDMNYDSYDQRDHFFSDNLRHYCDSCVKENGELIEFDEYIKRVKKDRSLDPILEYFDSISKDEDRLRWDRLVAFHLLLAGFINNIGYREQRTSEIQLIEISQNIKNYRVLQNLTTWLWKHGLKYEREAERIASASFLSVQ